MQTNDYYQIELSTLNSNTVCKQMISTKLDWNNW